MSKDFISMSIKNILEHGINLYLDCIEEEQYYLMKLFEYLEEKTDFKPYLKSDTNSIEIEDKNLNLVVELMIAQSTLYFIPYGQDVFDIFTDVLGFIAREHQKIVMEFRGFEDNKIEEPKNLETNNIYPKDNNEETEEESSSDDDYEWI